jgi:hypothetical protein
MGAANRLPEAPFGPSPARAISRHAGHNIRCYDTAASLHDFAVSLGVMPGPEGPGGAEKGAEGPGRERKRGQRARAEIPWSKGTGENASL